MARKNKPKSDTNTDGWLTTYADLLSLLLCFFVLMYTASTPDEARLQWILRSMSSLTGEVINHVIVDPMDDSSKGDEDFTGPDPAEASEGDVVGVPGPSPLTFDDLFNWVSNVIDTNDLSTSASVGMEQGKLHIRFDSDIMFAPDSYELLASGRRALNLISPGIRAVNDFISSVEVAGHTAAVPAGMRSGIHDWFLSSQRAVTVTNYLDFWVRMVDSEKFQTAGYGQYRPIKPNDIEDNRSQNRRVELVITRNEHLVERTAEVIDMLNHDYRLGASPGGGRQGQTAEEQVNQIRNNLYSRYGVTEEDAAESAKPPSTPGRWGPMIPGIPVLPEKPAENGDDGEPAE